MELEMLETNPWTNNQKILFRFLGGYAIWYILFPYLFEYTGFWTELGPWIGENILDFIGPIDTKGNGSGDKTIDFVKNFSVLVLGVVTATIWSILDRKRKNYNKLLYWFQVIVRYYLAMILMGYGFAKIYKTQFPFPSLNRLLQPFGEASPMGLAWTYMGYSTGFNYYTGFGEAMAGFLLLFRRTTLLGIFIGIPVMGTIVMMNFCYDIPVKLFSVNLLFLLICLLLPQSKRLANFFFLNKAAAPDATILPYKDTKVWKYRLIPKFLFIGYLLFSNINRGMTGVKEWGDQREKPPLYGIYTADQVIINKDTIPPLITDSYRWHTLTVDRADRGTIKTMDGKTLWCTFKPDTLAQTISFHIHSTMEKTATLKYEKLAKESLLLEGILISGGGYQIDTIEVHFQKKNLNDFELIKRNFNWINEYPHNR